MKQQKPRHSMYFSGQLFADWFNPPTGRRSKSQQSALAEHYQSKDPAWQQGQLQGLGMMGNLIKGANKKSEKEFYQKFVFGVPLKILRKGNIKQCIFFVDQNIPSFLWISTKSKAFLFDLTYTTIQRYSFEIERVTNLKHYFILYYFEEELPIVFQGQNAAQEAQSYFNMFQSYIIYNRIVCLYPSYFSQILKRYIIEQIKENVTRQKKCSEVLKVACDIHWNTDQHNKAIMSQMLQRKQLSIASDLSKIYLSPQEINDFFKISSCCNYTKETFEKYSGVKLANYLDYLQPCMRLEAFRQFLTYEQLEPPQFVDEICQETREIVSFYDFSTYLLNQQNNYAALVQKINEDLPLTDYFCYSSHNTYLSGNQLTSDSKIERYLQDLDNGLKCVEIDVHNDGQRPIITHAFNDKSFCKPIDFEETIKMIGQSTRKYKNHYPLILSIENHANSQNRYRMFNILYKIFEKKLFMVNNEVDFQKVMNCKTLAQLKGKIIIKTDSKISQIMAFKNRFQKIQTPLSPSLTILARTNQRAYFPTAQFSLGYQKFDHLARRFNQRKEHFQEQIQRQLYLPIAEMTKITGMFKTPAGIDTDNSCGYECTSLTNQKAAKSDEKKVIAYTKRSWLRIYPLGTQIASSNYNPIPHLKNGAQIIALNTQTKDDYAWLLMSYFICGKEINPSKTGYIPKPPHLLKSSFEAKKNVKKVIQVKNLSAQKISLRFFGSERDMNNNRVATDTFNISDYLQGFLMFDIGLKLKDCIPLRFIRQGFRVLVAKNQFFRDSGIRVLVQIQIKESVWS